MKSSEDPEETLPSTSPEGRSGSLDKDLSPVTEDQKRLLHRAHVNLGHPHRDQFLRVLRAAKVLPPDHGLRRGLVLVP